jgi:hypothetical protein
MPEHSFTEDDLNAFVARVEQTPGWRQWRRLTGEDGSDVLEIDVAGDPPATLRVTKARTRQFLATGFDGWGLTVCDDFSELLGILVAYRPGRRAPHRTVAIRAA